MPHIMWLDKSSKSNDWEKKNKKTQQATTSSNDITHTHTTHISRETIRYSPDFFFFRFSFARYSVSSGASRFEREREQREYPLKYKYENVLNFKIPYGIQKQILISSFHLLHLSLRTREYVCVCARWSILFSHFQQLMQRYQRSNGMGICARNLDRIWLDWKSWMECTEPTDKSKYKNHILSLIQTHTRASVCRWRHTMQQEHTLTHQIESEKI